MDDLVATFRAAAERASARVVCVADREEAAVFVDAHIAGRPAVWADEPPPEAVLRRAEVGIDRAEILIAETGTVVRTYASRAEARVSLVPPSTVFVAEASSLVADLPEALRLLRATHRAGRAATLLVTGPSRTADIEKELVIPAHGPREVVVAIVGQANEPVQSGA